MSAESPRIFLTSYFCLEFASHHGLPSTSFQHNLNHNSSHSLSPQKCFELACTLEDIKCFMTAQQKLNHERLNDLSPLENYNPPTYMLAYKQLEFKNLLKKIFQFLLYFTGMGTESSIHHQKRKKGKKKKNCMHVANFTTDAWSVTSLCFTHSKLPSLKQNCFISFFLHCSMVTIW